MSLPWRKRLEYRLLRWQARLEGTAFNRTGPWIFSVVLFVTLFIVGQARGMFTPKVKVFTGRTTSFAGSAFSLQFASRNLMPRVFKLERSFTQSVTMLAM